MSTNPETLEYWIRTHLLALLRESSPLAPFSYLVIETGLTKEQVGQILDLMDEVRTDLRKTGKSMNHSEFENRIYKIVPSRKGDYHFAEDIVSTLNDERRFTEVFDWMKKSGMNF